LKQTHKLSLNAKQMTTREEAHAHLKARLRLPDWYGNNLDALNDCLGEINEPTRIIVRYAPLLSKISEGYGEKILNTLHKATEENPNLQLETRDGFFRNEISKG